MEIAMCLFISLLSIPFSSLFLSLARILLRRLAPPLIQLHAGAHFAWLGGGAATGDDDLSAGDATSLNQLLPLLLHPHRRDVNINLNVARYERPSNDDEAAAAAAATADDCVFCLCGIEEGEEIRELRCRHVFHRRCLDRWLARRRPAPTCPLCREALVPPFEPSKGGGGGVVAADAYDEEELGDSAAVILLAYVQWLMW